MSQLARGRAGTLLAILLVAVLGVGVRLAFVQGVGADRYAAAAERQRVREIQLPAQRGAIYDRTGGELAISVPARTVYANPRQVADVRTTAEALGPLLMMDLGALESKLRSDKGFVYLARRIGTVTARKVADLDLPGIGVLEESRRLYPGGSLAAGVVGFIGTDQTGLSGLEYGYQDLLGGAPGRRILEQDPLGRRIASGVFDEVLPVPGSDLALTLDPDLQLVAEDAMRSAIERTGAEGGMFVALDPHGGDVLAMASFPTFDPNDISDIDPDTTRNRVVTDAFEPGSINKVITAAGVLEEGVFGPQDELWVPGYMKIYDDEFFEKAGARTLDLRGILAQSSNLGTIRLAQQLGAERLHGYFERFGYGQGTGLGFPGESAGALPSVKRWATSLPTMAIGQGLAVTPLQVAQVYATLANDGVSVESRLVSGWTDPGGVAHAAPQPRRTRVVSTETATTLRDMLREVVRSGTGTQAAIPGYTVAGKTGTADRLVEGVGYTGYMASFVGMVPAERPELVMAVVLDNPNPEEGGLAAAPVFAEVGKRAVRIMRIPPSAEAPVPARTP